MTETETKQRKKPGPKPKPPSLEEFLDKAKELSKEDKEALRRMGCVVPEQKIDKALKGTYTWGFRCCKCNAIAIYLVEDEWTMNDGTVTDVPPAHLQIDQILWTQPLPADQIDRHSPKCPSCRHPVDLTDHRQFRHDRKRLVRVADYRAAQQQDWQKIARDIKSKMSTMGEEGGGRAFEYKETEDGRKIAGDRDFLSAFTPQERELMVEISEHVKDQMRRA